MDQSTETTTQTATPPAQDTQSGCGCSTGRRVQRLFAIALGAAIFLGVASVIRQEPRPVRAAGPTWLKMPAPAQLPPGPLTDAHGGKLLGSMEGTTYRVLMYSSPHGPRYSVYTLAGKLLRGDMPAEDVYREFPDLDLTSLSATARPGASTDPATPSKPLLVGDVPSDN